MGASHRSPAITQAAKHYRRGLEDFRGGRFREATRHIRKAVEADPANVDWRYDLGSLLQKAERHEEAIAEYRRVLDAGGEAADALTNLALCLRALGKLHDAEAGCGARGGARAGLGGGAPQPRHHPRRAWSPGRDRRSRARGRG